MKIAVIIHELLVEGGGERQCIALAQALRKQGHQVTVFTCSHDASHCFPEDCKDLDIRQVDRGIWPSLSKPRFLRGYLDMKRLVASITDKYDVWNPHHWPAQWAALWLKKKLGGTVVWMCNDVPDFHEKSREARPAVRKPTVLISRLLHKFYYLFDKHQNDQIDLTVLVSNWAEKEFKKIYSGSTSNIGPGIEPSRFSPGGDRAKIRDRFGFGDDEFVLLWLGIYMPHRRLEDAIRAVSLMPSQDARVRLLLAGSDRSFPEYLDSLRALVEDLKLQDKVTFAGKVEDSEIRDFYSACDAFLFPNDQQTWGLAVLEAMACGAPVLVSRGAGVHEALTDGQNAILFPPRDPKILTEKIEYLASQRDLRCELSREGASFAREEYSWEKYAQKVYLAFSKASHSPEFEATVRARK